MQSISSELACATNSGVILRSSLLSLCLYETSWFDLLLFFSWSCLDLTVILQNTDAVINVLKVCVNGARKSLPTIMQMYFVVFQILKTTVWMN